MSEFDDREQNETPTPEDLCRQAFSRCSNWPHDRAGQLGLAQGLKVASDRFKVSQEALISACCEANAFCPTDADLLRVASDIFLAREAAHQAQRDRHVEWRKEYGDPEPEPIDTHGKCKCCGRDWKEIMKTASDRHASLWNGLREYFQLKKGQWPSYRDMAPIARKLGFVDYANAWERQ